MKFQATYRACMETECAAGDGLCRSQYLRTGGPVCTHTHTHTHTHVARWFGGMADCWSRFIFPITAFYPLGSTLSREYRRGFITVCDSRYGAVCTLWIHCPPGSGLIQPHTPSFQERTWCADIRISHKAPGGGDRTYMAQPGLGVHSKRFGCKGLLLFI